MRFAEFDIFKVIKIVIDKALFLMEVAEERSWEGTKQEKKENR
jgi:hypothetical protein